MSLLTTADVAKLLNITKPTVRRMIREGELDAITVCNRKRIAPKKLASYLEANETNNQTTNLTEGN